MTQSFRVPSGGRIDRSKPVGFDFNGQRYEGYCGDTLASALLANGVRVVARSYKYHRPRGVMAAGAEEPNALVQVGSGATTIPNLRATQTEIVDGMQAVSMNCWPSVDNDIGTVTGAFARMLPAGFYYKTFMWPPQMWMKYEHVIRKAAGFGTAPTVADPDRYDKVNAHCDVLVVGAGPAGLAAALSAAASGARVIVADEQSEFGGSLLHSRTPLDDAPATEWVEKALRALRDNADVTLLPRSTVYGYFDHNFLTIAERVTDHLAAAAPNIPRERLWRVRAKRVVLATGAIERPLVFPNNDRPGVMLASAVSVYINRYAVTPAMRAVVFTNNDSAYSTALDLADAGVPVSVVDARTNPGGHCFEALQQRGIEVLPGCVVTNVRGTKRISVVEIGRLNGAGDAIAAPSGSLGCDVLAMSGGWSPAVHLHAQSGARPRFDADAACFVPGESVQAECSVGAANGAMSLTECFAQGFAGGVAAAKAAGRSSAVPPKLPKLDESAEAAMQPLWLVPSLTPPGRGAKQFVDYQNDT
ncbi:MAG: 2Fe-2S iron-sulfur cluster-binding protein, partial [Gammaproteobacteria bacterium]|nr:2Fe-2S iron-sulfur cluster-binding protein [Gammaproteobacteria bacterium]